MRAIVVLIVAALATPAFAQVPHGEIDVGPRILGEPAFAFEMDALTPDEVTRPGWPVTTTRASPCMTYDGTTWTTQPADTACVGRWGLESFGSVTNYTVNSTGPFNAAPWFLGGSPSLESLGNGVWRATSTGATDYVAQTGPAVAAGEVWTVTAEVQGATSGGVRLRALDATAAGGTGVQCTRDVGAEWTRVSCTQTAVADGRAQATLYFDSGASRGSVQFRQIQLEKSSTPGPRHDCGAAACSRSADVHTVSTEGWPTTSGEIRLQYTPLNAIESSNRYLLDTRAPSSTAGIATYINATTGNLCVVGWGAPAMCGGALTWAGCNPGVSSCVSYDIRLVWSGTSATVYRDGSLVATATIGTPTAHHSAARLCNGETGAAACNGHIRLLRVSE